MNDLVTNQPREVADEVYLGKVVRDGKVAVLYSPGFGAGWYSWNTDAGKDILFDPMLVKYVEEGNVDAMLTYAEMRYPDTYKGGLSDLSIRWVDEGAFFRIDEYDGSESVEVLGDSSWIRA